MHSTLLLGVIYFWQQDLNLVNADVGRNVEKFVNLSPNLLIPDDEVNTLINDKVTTFKGDVTILKDEITKLANDEVTNLDKDGVTKLAKDEVAELDKDGVNKLANNGVIAIGRNSYAESAKTLIFILETVLSGYDVQIDNNQGLAGGSIGAGDCPDGQAKVGNNCIIEDTVDFD